MPWFRGDCHVHTRRSHAGEMTPAEVAAEARAAGLDFIAVTEHDLSTDPRDWAGLGLLVIPGREVLTPDGHLLELGDPPQLRIVAHPFAPYPGGTFRGSLDDVDAVEVWNGRWHSDLPWQADNERALAVWAGAGRPFVGNSDAHLRGQIGTPQLVVRAPELTAPAILAAIRAGRCWIAASKDIDIEITATYARITGVPSGTVTVHTADGRAHSVVLPADGPGSVALPAARVEVRHPGGRMAALANPLPA